MLSAASSRSDGKMTNFVSVKGANVYVDKVILFSSNTTRSNRNGMSLMCSLFKFPQLSTANCFQQGS